MAPRYLCLAIGMLLWASEALAQDNTLFKARDLIQQGTPAAAVELLQPLHDQYAEDARYHYLFGTALLDSGNHDKAVAEFKHALHIQPDLFQAEAELGRAYLLSGNYLAAQAAFQRVKEANPPAEVSASIDSYVDTIHQLAESSRDRFRGSLSLGLGYDSNINSATSAQQVTLPILGGIVASLSPENRSKSDSFYNLGAEVSGFYPLTENLELHGNAGGQGKQNLHEQYDYLSGNLATGLRYTFDQNQIGATLQYDSIGQDNQRVRDSKGIGGEFRRIVHPLADVSLYGQYSWLDYPDEGYRNADRRLAGIAINPAAFGKRLPHLPPILSAYGGEERPREDDVDHLGNRFWGARTTFIYIADSRLVFFAGLSYERRHYGAEDPLFLITRIDRQTDLSLGSSYKPFNSWSVVPAITHTDNKSTLDTNQYKRTAGSITLRYDF